MIPILKLTDTSDRQRVEALLARLRLDPRDVALNRGDRAKAVATVTEILADVAHRGDAAIVDSSLVIALPGKPSGAVECLGFVQGAIPHGVALAQRVPTSC